MIHVLIHLRDIGFVRVSGDIDRYRVHLRVLMEGTNLRTALAPSGDYARRVRGQRINRLPSFQRAFFADYSLRCAREISAARAD